MVGASPWTRHRRAPDARPPAGRDRLLTTVDGPFFTAAAALIRAARMQGAADARLHVDVEHDGQCNLEVAVPVLTEIQRLGIPLTMTCHEAGA